MKKISLVLIGLSTLIVASSTLLRAQTTNELYIINSEEVELIFTTEYDFNDLVDAKNALKELDIEIVYNSLKFNEEGNLSRVQVTNATFL